MKDNIINHKWYFYVFVSIVSLSWWSKWRSSFCHAAYLVEDKSDINQLFEYRTKWC
jgi:hypothetical protein